MATLKYWIWISGRFPLAPLSTFRLLEQFGGPEAAYFADPAEYDLIPNLTATARAALRDKSLEEADRVLAECDALGIRILTVQDAEYPDRLRQIADPPCVLYVRGRLPRLDDEVAISLVGARDPSPYGVKMAGKLGLELARSGAVVVSGSARGVDTAALRGALSGGGTVVSVLGNGVDVYYPPANRDLYADVAASGALISEFPPGTQPDGKHFPIRNRILSGISAGVAVVEGNERSGSLITARFGLEQDRDVFAVPGPADAPMSRGPNLLIRRGEAKLITCGWDILEEYEDRFPHKLRDPMALSGRWVEERLDGAGIVHKAADTPKRQPRAEKKAVDNPPARPYIDWSAAPGDYTDDERAILQAVSQASRTADELVEHTGIPARRVFSALTLLQLRGLLSEDPGKRFSLQPVD